MATGTVKWFNDEKGYGFIAVDGLAQDVFVHFSQILMDGRKKLVEGQRVMFDLAETNKGDQAERVEVIA